MIRNKIQLRSSNSPMRPYSPGSALLLALEVLVALLATPSAQAQILTVLHTFTGKGDGVGPYAGVIRDSSGKLYGTTEVGGSLHVGTVFEIEARDKETILHNFWGGDGLDPSGPLLRDQTGALYGTTQVGGTPEGGGCDHGCGIVFKLDQTGKESVLYAFTGHADGEYPEGELARDDAGNVYGITALGGDINCDSGGCGVAFKVDENGKETVLHTFTGYKQGDGQQPSGGLIRDKAGNLYGVTVYGGTSTNCDEPGCGAAFRIDANGTETVLYSFTGVADGMFPGAPLIRDSDGNLYGTASRGGDPSCSCGVVFKLDTNGKETVLYTFKGSPDGAYPQGEGLLRDKSGNLYGATFAGGTTGCGDNSGCGTIYKVDAKGNETVLYAFTGKSDGANPNGGLVMDDAGNLYGTASSGGDPTCFRGESCGVVFKLTP